MLYSVGDSKYLGGSATAWYTYTANWTASNLPVPGDASIEKARLYVMYTWDKVQGMPDNVSLKFNNNPKTRDAFYTDRKGFGSSNYPYGMLVYNVTGDFNRSGNSAILENLNPVKGNPSMRGMLLVVVYANESELQRKIQINEGFDLLYGGPAQCTTPEEATAYAPFSGTIDIANVTSAKLITVAPGAGPNEGELLFNGQMWYDVWNYAGSSQIGINETDVTSYVNATGNEAGFQSSADWMEASNAFLVVEYGVPAIEAVNITDFWIENRVANRSQSFRARLNLTTTADAPEGWYVVVVSGTGPESEGIAGVGTVCLTPGGSVNNMPVLVHIPALARIGDYNLIASVHTLDEYPGGLIAHRGPKTVTVQ